MYTISDILSDIQRGVLAHNIVESCFSYRLLYSVNEGGMGRKCHADTSYDGLRETLENTIRGNLTMTNTVVVSAVTIQKNGEVIPLLNRPYSFSLDGYFQQITGEKNRGHRNSAHKRKKANWC